MPDSQFPTNAAALTKATATKTTLALSKMRFFQAPFVPSRFTTKADMVAVECNYDGYPAGGFALTAWTGPTLFDGGGAVITSPLVNVVYGPAEDPPTGNQIGGWWIELASGAVWLVGIFDPTRPILIEGDGFALVVQIVEGRLITVG